MGLTLIKYMIVLGFCVMTFFPTAYAQSVDLQKRIDTLENTTKWLNSQVDLLTKWKALFGDTCPCGEQKSDSHDWGAVALAGVSFAASAAAFGLATGKINGGDVESILREKVFPKISEMTDQIKEMREEVRRKPKDYDNNVKHLTTSIDELQNKITIRDEQISKITDQMEQIKDRLRNFRYNDPTTVQGLERKISRLQGQIKVLNKGNTSIENRILELKEQIETIDVGNTSIKNQILKLEEDVKNLKKNDETGATSAASG